MSKKMQPASDRTGEGCMKATRSHLHRGVLIEERAGFHHDAFTGGQSAFENVAVAVENEEAGGAGGDEAVHIHALAAE